MLPEHYVVSKFYQFAGGAKHNRLTKTYQASCPVCREGDSWLKKKRLYYVVQKDLIFCHNCGWSGKPIKWIEQMTGLSYKEIKEDSLSYDTIDVNLQQERPRAHRVNHILPGDCINLYDPVQLNYHSTNEKLQSAVEYLKKRRLFDAVNRSTTLYFCLNDPVHYDRVVIPFFDTDGKIKFYQSRSVLQNDNRPKYLSKVGYDRTIFNINLVDSSASSVFVFEGPFNAFFTRNSIAIGGIQENSYQLFSKRQQEQADSVLKFHQKIWVLDSQWIDSASLNKCDKLVSLKQKVFIWPKELGKTHKDFNDLAIASNKNEISEKFILDNVCDGMEAQLRLSEIRRTSS